MREGAAGHDDQPLLILAEGERAGRRIDQSDTGRRNAFDGEACSSGKFAYAGILGIVAVGFDDDQLLLRRQRDGRSHMKAWIVGRRHDRGNGPPRSNDVGRDKHDGRG